MPNKKADITLYHPTLPQREALYIMYEMQPNITILNFGRQTGKMESLDSLLYSEDGPFRMGDVKIGDKIFTPEGELTDVIAIHPQGVMQSYDVTFNDGTIVNAGLEHLWEVTDHHGAVRIVDTEHLLKYHKRSSFIGGRIKNEYPFKVRLTKAVNYPERDLPLDPYTVGALIGDGSLSGSSAVLTGDDQEVIDNIPYEVTKHKKKYSYGVLGIMPKVIELGMNVTAYDKKIPKEYKYSSIEQRRALLQGLMDTDGSIDDRGYAEYYSVSKELIEDVADLARSLGLFAKVSLKNGRYKGEVHKSWRVSISYDGTFDLFRIKRKIERQRIRKTYSGFKRVYSVEKSIKQEMQCITVSSEEHLYLTDGYTTTHNSMLMVNDAITYGINNPNSTILYISPVYDQNAKIIKQFDAEFNKRKDIKELIFSQIRYKEQEFVLNNGSIISFRSAESGDSLRGRTVDRLYIDEAAFISKYVFTEILLPMTIRTGAQVIMSSTPNGRNWFYELYMQGQDVKNRDRVVSLWRNYTHLNDEAVNKVVEGFKSIMTQQEFNREVLGMFIAEDTLFLDVELCIGETVYDDTPVYIGIDIGITSDYTVVTVMDENYNIVEIDRFNMRKDGLRYDEYKERLMKMYYKYFEQLVAAYIEINNQELLYEELLDMFPESYKLMGFRTSPTNKPKIISFLIKLFEDLKITIPDDEQLIKELYAFKSKRNEVSGKLQYKASGDEHDDMVMSLAIAAHCADEEQSSGVIEFF